MRYTVINLGQAVRPAQSREVEPSSIEDAVISLLGYEFDGPNVYVDFNIVPASDAVPRRASVVELRSYPIGTADSVGLDYAAISAVEPIGKVEIPILKWGEHQALLTAPEDQDVEVLAFCGFEG